MAAEEEVRQVSFFPGDQLSWVTTQLQLYAREQLLGGATGFAVKFGATYGLVTNWHVVSGLNPATGSPLNDSGLKPSLLRAHVCVLTKRGPKLGVELFLKPLEIGLEGAKGPIWIESRNGENIDDIVLIPLTDHVPELARPGSIVQAIEGGRVTLTQPTKAKRVKGEPLRASPKDMRYLYPSVGSEVFILGYPLGIANQGVFPVWKRGSIASEPQEEVLVGGRSTPYVFYVDATTKRGMSGAPVVYRPKPGEILKTHDNISVKAKNDVPMLLGVYAGRDGVTREEYEMSLGRVWKAELIAGLFLKHAKLLGQESGSNPPTTPDHLES